MYRVRRIIDGKHLRVAHIRELVGEAIVVRWTDDLEHATEWSSALQAEAIIQAMIVIHKDAGIEVEPIN